MAQINWQRTRDILISIICICLIFWATWTVAGQFVDAIVILILSMAVAFLLTPAVDLLTRYHVPRLVATFVTYIVVLAVVGSPSPTQ
jgi:predicted PurR-regulated permease PerM